MIIKKQMQIKINHANRKKYEEITGYKLNNGDYLSICQTQLLPASRVEVECVCDYCEEVFYKKRVSLTSEITLCNNKCRDNYFKNRFNSNENPNPKKEYVEVNCEACNKRYQKDFLESQYDEIRVKTLESYGYKVHILWEKDVMNNLNECIKSIFKNVN